MADVHSSFLPVYEIQSSTDNDSSSRSSSESSRSSSTSPNLQAPVDDISIKVDPDRHVDYLSHDWSENDIWVSWRHVTKQKAFLQSGVRLENASWRTWAKSRNNLKTISPETLNWLKDCDVTWLYGPLHRGTQFESTPARTGSDDTLMATNQVDINNLRNGPTEWATTKPRLESHSSSYVIPSRRSNKPILKKRSNSEMMLARHNDVRSDYEYPGSPIDEAQRDESSRTPKLVRPVAIRTHSANSALRSARKQHFRSQTGGEVPEKHIHFNESVKQCISIIKPDPDDEYDSSSSDDAPTMRISAPKEPRNIRELPNTTLKLPSHTPVVSMHDQNSGIGTSAYEDDYAVSMDAASSRATDSGCITGADRPFMEDPILPNYEGTQAGSPPPGIFGRAAEVVSSARDLVSVIWSASGWRRPDNNS